MNKSLLIGAGVVVIGGAIATHVLLNNQKGNPFDIPQEQTESNREDEKIEQLYFDELQDKDRYTFCIGQETISGTYKNSIMGKEEGEIKYVSNDLSVFDKNDNKLYILARSIDYQYSGNADLASNVGDGILKIEESGNALEYYKKNSAPVRIDYNSKVLFPAPERKNKDWVTIITKSTGTVMGFTQTDTDEETGDAKTLCSHFSFGGDMLKNGAIATPEFFSLKGKCPENISIPGVSFLGDFEFECNNIDSKQGIELLKDYKEREALRNNLKTIDSDTQFEGDNKIKDAIKESKPSQKTEDVQKALEQMRQEMNASQKAE